MPSLKDHDGQTRKTVDVYLVWCQACLRLDGIVAGKFDVRQMHIQIILTLDDNHGLQFCHNLVDAFYAPIVVGVEITRSDFRNNQQKIHRLRTFGAKLQPALELECRRTAPQSGVFVDRHVVGGAFRG